MAMSDDHQHGVYNPATGTYATTLGKTPPSGPCAHTPASIYWDPCLTCGTLCSCVWTIASPQVVVRSLDGKNVTLSSNLVMGSEELQRRLQKIRYKTIKWVPFDLRENAIKKFFEGEKIDMRESSEPTFGVTEEQWKWLEMFQTYHLQMTEDAVNKEKASITYFKYNPKPPRPVKPPINYWGYYDWEEKIFQNMEPSKFLGLVQAKHELKMICLHVVLEKWFCLYRGIPNVEDFGKGYYFQGLTHAEFESGCKDFLTSKPVCKWGKTFHFQLPLRKDPESRKLWRKYIWKKY